MKPKTRSTPRAATVRSATKPSSGMKTAAKKKPSAPKEEEKASPLNIPPGVLLGAHTSTAGGVAQSIVRATACGFTAAQIFVKNNKQWFAPPLPEADVAAFRAAREKS